MRKMVERCMKYYSVLCVPVIIFFCFGASSLPLPGDQDCRLNCTAYPYKPTGGCTGIQEKLQDWHGFPQTSCCQNALLVYAHALALRASDDPSGTIFIPSDQWTDCSVPFPMQPSVSVKSCGFEDFFYGRRKCSMLLLKSIDQKVVDQCSRFGPFSSFSFDDACGSCTSAISSETGSLLTRLRAQGDEVEEALCRVALLVAVIAGAANRSSGFGSDDDLIRCLPALAAHKEPETYIKVKDGVAEALLSVILVMLGLTAVTLLIKHVTRRRKKEKKEVLNKELATKCSCLYKFSKSEIENAINFTVEKKFLGRGSAGQVYKGMLPSGQLVAIKQLFQSNTSDSFFPRDRRPLESQAPNLVCLFGCCIADEQQYLVYEYCPNGNLAQHLLKKDCVLTWAIRVKILRDCAAALKHLHFHISGCIVHRDIKLTNILLTQDMEPKLSDFGLSKMMGMEESKVFTDVRGTIGYLDPEYMTNAKLTCASDIYSFGIVILQLLSGQRVIELDLDARDQLKRKAVDVSMGKRPLADFQDDRMTGNVNSMDFESILQIAVLCTSSSSTGRPTIDLVFDELERVWKDTHAEMNARKNRSPEDSTTSESAEMICV